MTPTPTPATTNQTVDEILHVLVVVGISMASIFVKNPSSVQKAGQIADLLKNTVLPIADSLLGQK